MFACLQVKDGDPGCLSKAQGSCAAAVAKLSTSGGSGAKLAASIVKACDLQASDVTAREGLGFGAYALACKDLGVASVGTVAEVAECIRRQHACRAAQMVELEVPRLRELLAQGGVTLP